MLTCRHCGEAIRAGRLFLPSMKSRLWVSVSPQPSYFCNTEPVLQRHEPGAPDVDDLLALELELAAL